MNQFGLRLLLNHEFRQWQRDPNGLPTMKWLFLFFSGMTCAVVLMVLGENHWQIPHISPQIVSEQVVLWTGIIFYMVLLCTAVLGCTTLSAGLPVAHTTIGQLSLWQWTAPLSHRNQFAAYMLNSLGQSTLALFAMSWPASVVVAIFCKAPYLLLGIQLVIAATNAIVHSVWLWTLYGYLKWHNTRVFRALGKVLSFFWIGFYIVFFLPPALPIFLGSSSPISFATYLSILDGIRYYLSHAQWLQPNSWLWHPGRTAILEAV